ncbi:MAG: hypothetical protein OHK0046_13870 [Anaerolineae bacterium]
MANEFDNDLDWMRGNNNDDSSDDDSFDDLPEWMRGADEGDAPPSGDRTGLTGTLSWQQSTTPESGLGDDDEDDVPDWMRAAQNRAESGGGDDDDNLPDWMTGGDFDALPDDDLDDERDSDRDSDRDNMFEDVSQAFASDDVPDWMRGSEFDDFDEHPPQPRTAQPAKEELPDWLLGADDDDDDDFAAAQPAFTPEEDDTPDWLMGAEDEEDEAERFVPSRATSPLDAEESLPDWLVGAESDEDEPAPGRTFASTPQPAFTPDDDEDDVPDWMRGAPLEEDEDDLSEDAPDWIRGEASAPDTTMSEIDRMFGTGDDEEDEELFFAADTTAEDEDFDLLFGSEDFDTEDDFDLLGELTAEVPTEDAEDFDLLGELTEDDLLGGDDNADFDDFFGDDENAFGEEDDLFAADAPVRAAASATMSDDDDFDDLFGDKDDAPFMRSQPAATADDDFDDLFGDEVPVSAGAADDDDFDNLFGDEVPVSAGAADDDDFDDLFGDDDPFRRTPVDEPDLDALFGDLEEQAPEPQRAAERGPIAQDADFEALFGDDDDVLPGDDDFDDLFGDDEDAAGMPLPAVPTAGRRVSDDDLEALFSTDNIDEEPVRPAAAAPASRRAPSDDELSGDVDFDVLFGDDTPTFSDDEDEGEELPEFSPDAPEWLTNLNQTSTGSMAAAIVRQQKDRPVDDLPESLQELRERGLRLGTAERQRGNTGLLPSIIPGVSDPLPMAVFDKSDPGLITSITITETERERANLLRDLTGTAPESAPVSRRGRLPLGRISVAVFIFLAMLTPFFNGVLNIGDLPPAVFEPGTREAAFYAQMDALQPGDLVLVAAEYGPTGAAELDDATETLLLHALLRGARPVVIGGNAVGLLHVENLLNNIAEVNPSLRANYDYYTGQYLVGDVIGLRAFNENVNRLTRTNIRGDATGLDVDSLDAFALIVVVAERADVLRGWAEQVAPTTDTPFIAVTGFAAAPLSEPYLEVNSDDIPGWLVGYEDAYTYRRMIAPLLVGGVPPTATPVPAETEEPAAETPELAATAEVTEEAAQTAEATPEVTEAVTEEVTEEVIITEEPTPEVTPTLEPTLTPTLAPTNTPTVTPTPSPMPTATPEPVIIGVVVAGSRVNLRNGPSTTESPVGSLAPGERVTVIGTNLDGTWFNIVTADGITGWVADFLLEVQSLTAPDATATAEAGVFVPRSSVQNEGRVQLIGYTVPRNQPVATGGPFGGAQPPFGGTPGSGGFPPGGAPLDVPGSDATGQPVTGFPPFAQQQGTSAPPVAATTAAIAAVTDAVTAPVDAPTQQPTTAPAQVFTVREIAAPGGEADDLERRDARWYSITIGIVVSALVIAGGSVVNVFRSLQRRRRK